MCHLRASRLNVTNWVETGLTIYAGAILIILAAYMVGSVIFLRMRYDIIKTESFKNKFGALTLGLHNRDMSPLYYPFTFMLRRYLFALIAVYLSEFNFFQIQILVFKSSMVMAFQGQVKPFQDPFQNKLELTNETLTLIATYGLFIFTSFVPDPVARYQVGWVIVGITCVILISNISVLFYRAIADGIRSCKIKKHKY